MDMFKPVKGSLSMKKALKNGYTVSLALLLLIMVSCTGSKQTVKEEPAPEPVVEETAELPEVEEEKIEAPPKAALVLKTVFFNYDQSELRDDARQVLQDNARSLRNNLESRIVIEGHCDERGTVDYNLALGDRRAGAVKQYLIDLGISEDRISTISYGKERPLSYQKDEGAYSKNRRAEFVIRHETLPGSNQ